jgi:hypothetical protein
MTYDDGLATVVCHICGETDCVEHYQPSQFSSVSPLMPVNAPGRPPRVCPECNGAEYVAGCYPCGGTGRVWEPAE